MKEEFNYREDINKIEQDIELMFRKWNKKENRELDAHETFRITNLINELKAMIKE